MSTRFTRREAIKALGAASALGAIGVHPSAAQDQASRTRRRVLRVAHLTDIHVEPERNAPVGLASCLRHVQSLKDKPELILFGGDAVMDSFEADDARTKVQWDLWKKIFKDECSLPVQACIGNHDIWGGNKAKSRTTGDEPNYGKKRAMENFAIAERYRSFESPRGEWHFIVLDSAQVDGDGYKAVLDEPQFEWLASDLKSVDPKTPVLVLSHIPIVSATVIVGAADQPRSEWNISGSLLHLDAIRLKNLFNAHPNVKLCLSGHVHLVDRVDYNGVSYLCNGAVSGAWWKGKNKECSEGYAVIDLFDDGTFEHQYITYGWQAAPA